MTPDDERRIEEYFRRPDALTADERRAVEQMVDREEAARVYADVMETFYDFLEDEEKRATDPRVDAFVDDLFAENSSPSVVPVRPVRSSQSSRPTVLAAATAEAADGRRFSILATLAAEEEDVLVRIIDDRETGQGRLYVLADSPGQQSHAVVSFPELGLDLVADANGLLTFDLPPDVDPDQWEQTTAVVRRPVAAGRLQPTDTLILREETEAPVRCSRANGTLTVAPQASGEDPSPSLLTVTPTGADGTNRVLLRLPEDDAVQHDIHADGDLLLRLYE